MKKAAKIMYLIGIVVLWLEFVGIAIAFGFISYGIAAMIGHGSGFVIGVGTVILLFMIVIPLVLSIIITKQSSKIKAKLENDEQSKINIFMLIVGIILQNYFLLLGGIFGMVYLNQVANNKAIETNKAE